MAKRGEAEPGGLPEAAEDSPPDRKIVGPVSGLDIPRFAGPSTFARLPALDRVSSYDVAILGVPFDSGVTYRPGARFGPLAVRQASRLLRAYHPGLEVEPFGANQVVDAGDVPCSPFSIASAMAQISESASELLRPHARVLAIGGDHSIALPMLRAVSSTFGPVALVHFDAHLDTQDSYFGERYTHGTPFRRAWEEGLLLRDSLTHVGMRAPLHTSRDLEADSALGFNVITCMDIDRQGLVAVAEAICERVGQAPLYVSIDIDVLDPAFAPGTGTPEAGGLSSRELLAILRGLAGLHLVAGDVVEVSPPYDHSEITCIAAAHVLYEMLGLMAKWRLPRPNPGERC